MVLTHRVLLTEIWGKAYENEVQYLRVYAAQPGLIPGLILSERFRKRLKLIRFEGHA